MSFYESVVTYLSFVPRVTPLEIVQPWRYKSWDRIGESDKPGIIPAEMRV